MDAQTMFDNDALLWSQSFSSGGGYHPNQEPEGRKRDGRHQKLQLWLLLLVKRGEWKHCVICILYRTKEMYHTLSLCNRVSYVHIADSNRDGSAWKSHWIIGIVHISNVQKKLGSVFSILAACICIQSAIIKWACWEREWKWCQWIGSDWQTIGTGWASIVNVHSRRSWYAAAAL